MFGNRSICILTLVAFMSAFLPGCRHRHGEEPVAEVNDSIPAMGFWPDSLCQEAGKVRPGETFTGLMTRLGMASESAFSLVNGLDSVFDVRKLRADNPIVAYYQVDSSSGQTVRTLKYVEYKKNIASSIIFKAEEPVGAWNYERPVVKERRFVDVTISSSLWQDMKASGADPRLIASLSDIYAWTVDFFGLQDGDEFKVMYQQSVCEADVVAIDTIYYAEFHRGEKVIPAVRFEVPEVGGRYWKPDGESMKGAFLKAPLQFSRISSGFSYHRKHPVTGKVRPHTAVDYAAPAGTPVMSIGDGTVLSAGWSGGGGNTVKIRHNGGIYTTAYLHLSRYGSGIKAGARVRQGQVIGYVGSTGVSTGPHLDFRVWKNGTPVNPLKIDNVPEPPIARELRPALDSVYMKYSHIMDSLTVCRSSGMPAGGWK